MIGAMSALAAADLALFAFVHYQGWVPAFWFVPGHIVLTLAALIVWFRHQSSSETYGIPVLTLGAAFGPCGMVLFSLARPMVWSAKGKGRAGSATPTPPRRPARQSDNPARALARMLEGRISFPDAVRIESFNTTLRFGELVARRKALEAVVRSFEPKLSPLIAIALTDRDQTIRALAAAASAQISSDVAQKVSDLESMASQRSSPREMFSLALSLADHGSNNVLLPQTQRTHLCRIAGRYLAGAERQMPHDDRRSGQLSSALRDIREHIPRIEIHRPAGRGAALPETPV